MLSGIINIIKPAGMTSHDVVDVVRKKLGIKKVGHTGTLDPNAFGVLPICVGRATKISQYITAKSKVYVAEIVLGITTDTEDSSGKVLQIKDASKVKKEEFVCVAMSFKGEIKQIPPMASAVKVHGRRLYDLHRKGIEIERTPRAVKIYDIKVLEFKEWGSKHPKAKFEVECSKGTYIRTLCKDIGDKLKVGAHMVSLIRTAVGNFKIENAIRLDDFVKSSSPDALLISIDEALKDYPEVFIKPSAFKSVISGAKLYLKGVHKKPENLKEGQLIRLKMNDELIALATVQLDEKSSKILFKPVYVNVDIKDDI